MKIRENDFTIVGTADNNANTIHFCEAIYPVIIKKSLKIEESCKF